MICPTAELLVDRGSSEIDSKIFAWFNAGKYNIATCVRATRAELQVPRGKGSCKMYNWVVRDWRATPPCTIPYFSITTLRFCTTGARFMRFRTPAPMYRDLHKLMQLNFMYTS